MLMFAGAVKCVTKEFSQRTYRNQRPRSQRLHMASFFRTDTILSATLRLSECKKRELESENAYISRHFIISSRLDRLLNDFLERLDGARGGRQMPGPRLGISVEASRLQSRLRRAHDIELRIIADVQHLCSGHAGLVEQALEYASVRFGGAGRDC